MTCPKDIALQMIRF